MRRAHDLNLRGRMSIKPPNISGTREQAQAKHSLYLSEVSTQVWMVKLLMSSAYFYPVQADICLYVVLSNNYLRHLGSCVRLGSHHMARSVTHAS